MDVSVSTPRMMCALVEEAVTVGDLVRLFTFKNGSTNLVEMTLPADSPSIGRRIDELDLPGEAVLVVTIRDGRALAPDREGALEAEDELLFVTAPEDERALADRLTAEGVTPRVISPPN